MKRPALDGAAYRRGIHAAKRPPRFRKCPYTAGTVAAESWHRGTYDRDTGLPPLVAQIDSELRRLMAEIASQSSDMWRALKESDERGSKHFKALMESDDRGRRIAEEAYESEERHVRKIAALNGELRDAETRDREAREYRSFVEETARLIGRARERYDMVEIDRLTENLKRGW